MQVVLAYGAESNRQLGIEGEVHHRRPLHALLQGRPLRCIPAIQAYRLSFFLINRIILCLCNCPHSLARITTQSFTQQSGAC